MQKRQWSLYIILATEDISSLRIKKQLILSLYLERTFQGTN